MKNAYKILMFLVVSILVSCSSSVPTKILPQRNLDAIRQSADSVNTSGNEISPYLRVQANTCRDSYFKEFSGTNYTSAANLVKPSTSFFDDMMGKGFAEGKKNVLEYLTNNLEAVSYLTYTSGFVAFSHPPDTTYTNLVSLPFYGSIGGTDLFSFNLENGQYIFRALPTDINSIFWDSHPWIGQDSLCNLVLIWASDREHPYSVTTNLKNEVLRRGNSDIYYAFRIDNVWYPAVKFQTTTGINTDEYNEISPFVACANISPKLFFSTNRPSTTENHTSSKDYDIYSVSIDIDYQKKTISVKDEKAELLPKGKQSDISAVNINTDADEIFPFVAYPYPSGNDKELFVSSNRNIRETPVNRKGDTLLVSKGKFDIYMLPYTLECKLPPPPPPPPPPMVKIIVNLIDKVDNSRPVIDPIIKIVEIGSKKEYVERASSLTYQLEPGKQYDVFGGSERNTVICEEQSDSLLKYYQSIKIDLLEPKITKREKLVEYDSIINPTLMIAYDTTYTTSIVAAGESAKFEPKPVDAKTTINPETKERVTIAQENVVGMSLVKCPPQKPKPELTAVGLPPSKEIEETKQEDEITIQVPYIEVSKQIISKREWFSGGKTIQKSYKLIEYDTLQQLGSTVINAIGPTAKSELTHLATIKIPANTRDTLLNDQVLVQPVYLLKPPCAVDFIDNVADFNQNVPYFQTAFWKVNTSKGLAQHLQDFQADNYLSSAGYIELHPRHRMFGVQNAERRESRKASYQSYSKDVDKNLIGMRNEITEHFIPALDEFNQFSPGTKLLIKLEAYSDLRNAELCNYIGENISYLQGKVDRDNKFVIVNTEINNRASLDIDNDNLSKLRVYYGYNELLALLLKDNTFKAYYDKGMIFNPLQKYSSQEEMETVLKNAKIIILIEGKKYDKVVKENILDYDPVRRLDLHIQLIQYENRRVIPSPCCTETKAKK